MELKAHFSNIHSVIIGHLGQAQTEVLAAIAWFTDRDIFEMLCRQARAGVNVTVALIGDEINQGPGGLNFHRLTNLGGQVIFVPPGSRNERTMHHKFCIIDRATVITGSYNWSHKARSNDENITVVTDSTDFASKYLDTFDSLIVRTGRATPLVADVDAARQRLGMIRNLVLLGEQADIGTQLGKLRLVAKALQLDRIIAALDNGEYKDAIEFIDAYLRKATSLVVAGLADVPLLRFQLENLEFRLESLSDEKGDLERRLITFNRRHDDALGNLIKQILKARAELARLLVEVQKNGKVNEEAQAASRDAEDTYKDYSKYHEDLQLQEPLRKLDEAAEQEIKALYRRACGLCHPDKVSDERKEAAHIIFVELQEAYKSNDLPRVRTIHEGLAAGGLPKSRSNILSEVDALKVAIAELEYAIAKLVTELKALHASDGVKLMDAACAVETDWECFFAQQRGTLENELKTIESKLLALTAQRTGIGLP